MLLAIKISLFVKKMNVLTEAWGTKGGLGDVHKSFLPLDLHKFRFYFYSSLFPNFLAHLINLQTSNYDQSNIFSRFRLGENVYWTANFLSYGIIHPVSKYDDKVYDFYSLRHLFMVRSHSLLDGIIS